MNEILSALVIFTTHLLEAITGFGSSVMALPFLNITMGLRPAVHLLCVLGWFMAAYIVVTSRKYIVWREFFFITGWVAIGMPLGLWMFDSLSPAALCIVLGAFMIGTGIRGEILTVNSKNKGMTEGTLSRNPLMKLLLFSGGIIQGAFGSGGPFIVIYSAKALPDKRVFRVTLSMLWLTLNSFRLVYWVCRGDLAPEGLGKSLIWAFPVLAAGIFAGDFLHKRVSEYHFKLGVYGLLAISGIFMLTANAIKLKSELFP